ncbi:MAG: hypothetical protein NVS3B10_31860 [Polyangiales bacterium]
MANTHRADSSRFTREAHDVAFAIADALKDTLTAGDRAEIVEVCEDFAAAAVDVDEEAYRADCSAWECPSFEHAIAMRDALLDVAGVDLDEGDEPTELALAICDEYGVECAANWVQS